MKLLNTVLSVIIFLSIFVTVEYVTYRFMERDHEKRSIYRLFFIIGWSALALIHMWVVAPWLNLPPTAVIALGLGIIIVFIAGGIGLPVFKSVDAIGLYPFAMVYQMFAILLLFVEAVSWATSSLPVPEFGYLTAIVPTDARIQAALGFVVAASIVSVIYYNPRGKNGYHYAMGRHITPSVDYEKFRQIHQENETAQDEGGSSNATGSDESQHHSHPSKAPARAANYEAFEYDWANSEIGFDDVGGYYEVKQRLTDEVLQPIQAAIQGDERFDRFGIEPSRGILLHGPPGTGKTLFARALAGELAVPFVELGPADITSKWINEGPQRVRQLFEEAESVGPCVIFLDEAEHLLGGREVGAGGAHAEDRKITSELLVHLTADDRTAIVVGATNRPEDIDPAILRPGRLATHIEIGLPEEESRHAIFQSKLQGVPHELTGDGFADLARRSRGLSGADIEEVVTKAKRNAATRDADRISLRDFPSVEDHNVTSGSSSSNRTPDVRSGDTDWTGSASDDDSAVGFQ
ncbi:AAA family ATPase [Haloarcula sediminis]|uniref:AAA family ATPase n=1 Tax=Haloarcula sediminis TaxID=3111777 RepID=UPI002D776588|nr:AAA family ATPase [Haloarcula sp. CK38]